MKEKLRLYLWLCSINLFISGFTFGGGYIVVPMIKKYYIERKKLFSEEELMEMAAIAQSSPGSIAVNLSVLAGKRSAGVIGAAISLISSLLPPVIILSFISRWYFVFSSNSYILAVLKGMQACVGALIVDMIIDMYRLISKQRSFMLNIIVPLSFTASFFLNINVILILIISCLFCILDLYIRTKTKRKADHTC